MKLVLATNNPGKVKEFARILEPLGIEVITQKQAGADLHVEENGETFAENARLKAMAVYRATGLPTVADDSGLCVDALDGKPGVYSARWYGEDTPYTEKNAPPVLWRTSPACFPRRRFWTARASARAGLAMPRQEKAALDTTRFSMWVKRALAR